MTTITDPSDRAVETGLGIDPDALAPEQQKSFAELGVDPAIVEALELSRRGLGFTDALHIASSRIAERFATFDRTLIRRARAAATHIVVAFP